jgi:hypothetical protein
MTNKEYLAKNGKSLLISLIGFMALAIGLGLADVVVLDSEVAMFMGALSSFLINFGRLTIGKNGS